jgi:hypothetical protein
MITNVQAAIDAVAGSAVPLNSAVGLGRIFELYVVTGIAERLLYLGWTVQLQRSDGILFKVGDPYIQRGGKPSGVAPSTHGPNGPSSILIRHPRTLTEWEIWNGVQFRGRSHALHVFDVAIVPRGLASDLRAATNVDFPFGRPIVAIECKDVQSAGSPDEMRTLVARLYDVTLTRSHTYLTGGAPVNAIYPIDVSHSGYMQAHNTYRDSNLSTKSVLARTGGFSSGAIAMTSYYRIGPYDQVTPGTATAAKFFDDVSNWIDRYL